MAGHAWLDVLVGIAAALLLSWLALVITLAVGRPKGGAAEGIAPTSAGPF
jgi:hypothetical protein